MGQLDGPFITGDGSVRHNHGINRHSHLTVCR
jgi:hypothetical protein